MGCTILLLIVQTHGVRLSTRAEKGNERNKPGDTA